MSVVTLIHRPERDRPARTGPYRFPYPAQTDPKSKDKNKQAEFELKGAWIHPGTQAIAAEEYAALEKNPNFQRCVKTGVIEVIKPVTETITGTTADYDSSDVSEIIDNSGDIEWLRSSAARETRPEVAQMCQARVKVLEEESKPKND